VSTSEVKETSTVTVDLQSAVAPHFNNPDTGVLCLWLHPQFGGCSLLTRKFKPLLAKELCGTINLRLLAMSSHPTVTSTAFVHISPYPKLLWFPVY